jgi:hypothetical protein
MHLVIKCLSRGLQVRMRSSSPVRVVSLSILLSAFALISCSDDTPQVVVEERVAVNSTTATTIQQTTTTQPSPTTTISDQVSSTSTTELENTDPLLTNAASLSTGGLGPVAIGMSLSEAEEAARVSFVLSPGGSESCRSYSPASGAVGVSFIFNGEKLVRIEILSGPIKTRSGYGLGSSKLEIMNAFGERIQESASGDNISYVPVDKKDLEKRVIWQVDENDIVTSLRSGIVPHIAPLLSCLGE